MLCHLSDASLNLVKNFGFEVLVSRRTELQCELNGGPDDYVKAPADAQPRVVLEAEDGSGLALALMGPDSPQSRADGARMMVLWNAALASWSPYSRVDVALHVRVGKQKQ